MPLSEQRFQAGLKYGGLVLAMSVVLNVYFVMRHFEIYRAAQRADRQVQILMQQQQLVQSVLQEFRSRAVTDTKVREILQRHQMLPAANSESRSRP